MGRKRDKERQDQRKQRRRSGNAAKSTLAANLKEDLGIYDEEIWTEDADLIGSTDGEVELVEALLTSQGSAPIPKGKKKRLYGDSEEEDGDEYHEQYSGSGSLTPRTAQEGPSRRNVSMPGQSLLDQYSSHSNIYLYRY